MQPTSPPPPERLAPAKMSCCCNASHIARRAGCITLSAVEHTTLCRSSPPAEISLGGRVEFASLHRCFADNAREAVVQKHDFVPLDTPKLSYLEAALQASPQGVELLDVRPVRDGEAAVLEADDLFRRLVLADRGEQLPERSSLLLLRLSAQLRDFGSTGDESYALCGIIGPNKLSTVDNEQDM